jgi:hypothetical protein
MGEKTMEDKKKKNEAGAAQTREDEKLSRREAMKRMAKGIALVGTLGVAGVVTQGQDECSSGYVNLVPSGYYNYSNSGYYNYSDGYNDSYHDAYYNYYNTYDNYSDYNDYYNKYSDYNDHGYFNYHPW